MSLDGQHARVEGLIDVQHLKQCHALFIGAGSAGSPVIEQSARQGLGHIMVVDDDIVSPRNMIGTNYVRSHIGRPKVESQAEIVMAIDDSIDYTGWQHRVTMDDVSLIRRMAEERDLIGLFADDPGVMLAISDACYDVCPVVRTVFGENCNHAEIAFSTPGMTAPISVSFGNRRTETRIEVPSALGCDTNMASQFTARLCLKILLGNHKGHTLFPLYRRAPLMIMGLRRTLMFAEQPEDLVMGCLAVEVPWSPRNSS